MSRRRFSAFAAPEFARWLLAQGSGMLIISMIISMISQHDFSVQRPSSLHNRCLRSCVTETHAIAEQFGCNSQGREAP